MPRKTKAELIADYERKLIELKAKDDESKQNKIVKLDKEVEVLDTRIAKLNATRQSKLDEKAVLELEIANATANEPADAVSADA